MFSLCNWMNGGTYTETIGKGPCVRAKLTSLVLNNVEFELTLKTLKIYHVGSWL